jgi:hypothetical protein
LASGCLADGEFTIQLCHGHGSVLAQHY